MRCLGYYLVLFSRLGRIVGESAAIFLTAGTVAAMPESIFSSARTLTVHSYLVTQESGDIELAAAVGLS